VKLRLHTDPEAFARLARPLLDTDPVRHTFALTALERVRSGAVAAPLMLTMQRRGEVVGAVLRTDGNGVIVSALPAACVTAVDAAAAQVDPSPRGVSGPCDVAHAYAAAVTARTGARVDVAMRMRLFRLVALTAPTGVPGGARCAGPDDLELLARWQTAFGHEALVRPSSPTDPRPGIRAALERGGLLLWEVDRHPVAYAGARPPIAGMSRVGPVYTPPEHRGHGYGSAVTAAATAWALAAGARDVVLFTDLANPVSNAIYPRIGFRPVQDAVELTFAD
jgi:predicted GNAT family acetyltransferase